MADHRCAGDCGGTRDHPRAGIWIAPSPRAHPDILAASLSVSVTMTSEGVSVRGREFPTMTETMSPRAALLDLAGTARDAIAGDLVRALRDLR